MDEVAVIAGRLTKRSKRAIVRMGEAPVYEGGKGPASDDVYSLWWGRDGVEGLTEHPAYMESGRWLWSLTPLGLAVRAHLIAQESRND